MLHFFSHNLELCVPHVLARDDGPTLCVGVDYEGRHWLLYRGAARPGGQVWVCAPASARAVDCVRQGTASVHDALLHSLTGTVEIVTVGGRAAHPDRCVRCPEIPPSLLPNRSWHVGPHRGEPRTAAPRPRRLTEPAA